MAGSLYGLGLSQQHDSNGRPLSGAKLYIYEAGTTTPATTYTNYALSEEHPFPIVADANGRVPSFWLADGSYRARLTTSGGVVQFDEDSIQALGPSSGEGGGSDTTPAAAIAQTGDVDWQPRSGTRSGWVRHNARTIGSASSGASERANADCETLYAYLWNNYSDTLYPVSGGRGASAAADWAANKPIGTLDLRGRSPVGLDDMGNSSASRLSGVTFTTGDATTAASLGGAATHTLTWAQLPTTDLTATVTDPGHRHFEFVPATGTSAVPVSSANQPTTNGDNGNNDSYVIRGSATDATAGRTSSATTGITVDVQAFGSGETHNNMQPFATGTWYCRL